MNIQKQLTYSYIFRFWSPLAFTWFLMALEGPIIAGVIARLDDPKFNLAAYGIAFAFALIFEAPVIMLMSSSAALVKNLKSFHKVLEFTRYLNLGIFCINCLVLLPAVFSFLMQFLNLPSTVANLVHGSLMILLPWPVAIGFRRFYQGILINHNHTRTVAKGTIFRLLFMVTCSLLGLLYSHYPGAYIGAFALSAGVISECIYIFIKVRPVIKNLEKQTYQDSEKEISIKQIAKFYYPLALTSFISLSVQPFVTFFVGQCELPIESLAVLPVINAFIFVFRCLGLSYQEVVIVLIGKNFEGFYLLKSFTYFLSICSAIILFGVAFTPFSHFWFQEVAGLSPELSRFAIWPFRVMSVLPPLTFILSWLRSMSINYQKNILITYASCIEVFFIMVSLSIFAFSQQMPGAPAACLSLCIGRIASCLYLGLQKRHIYPQETYSYENI